MSCEGEKGIFQNDDVLRREVEGGNNKAKTSLAMLMLTGLGGAKVDRDSAVKLLKERVKDNDSEAMWMLAICYEYGLGVHKSEKDAEDLFEASSQLGNEIGSFLQDSSDCMRGCGEFHANCVFYK